MKNSTKLAENFDESLKHKRFKKIRRDKGSRTKRLGKTNVLGIDNREMISQTDSNSKLKLRTKRMKTSQESIKKNNSKRAAVSLQGTTGFEIGGKTGISKGMQHQDVISYQSVVITLTVVIPVSIAIFFMVRSFNKRRKKKRKKKAERKNVRYKFLEDSAEKSWTSISSGEADAASAVEFINMMESTSLSELASLGNDTEKYLNFSDNEELQKKIKKEITKGKKGLSLKLPPINLLWYNGFIPSNSDLPFMASLTKVCSENFKTDIELCNALKLNTNFITTDSKESLDSLCDRGFLSPNLSSIGNSGICCSQICLKIQDKSLLKKEILESETKKSSMKNSPGKVKELSDFQGEKINLKLKNGDELPVVDSRMSFTTACTTLEKSKRGIISEIKSTNRCSQSVKENQDEVANYEAYTNEINWTPKSHLKPKTRDRLKCKIKQDDQVSSESKQNDLKQTIPLKIEISCLAQKNEHESNTPKSLKSSSSKPKSNLPCNTKSPTSKVMPKSVCTQTSNVYLQTVEPTHNRNCITSNAQKSYKVECVKFLTNQNHSNGRNGKIKLKSISKQFTVTSSKSGIENHVSTRKSLELVRKNLNGTSKREKRQKIRRHKTKKDSQLCQQPNSSISKSKSDIRDEIPCSQNGYRSKFGRNTQNETELTKKNLLQSTSSSFVVQPEKVPVNSEESIKFLDSSNNEGLSSSSKLACGKTPNNTENSGLSTSYSTVHNNSLKQQTEFEKNQRITSGSSTSYFKCGKTPKNTELESNKSYFSHGSESTTFNCGKAPNNTENEAGESNSFQSTIFNNRKPSTTEKCFTNNSIEKENCPSIDFKEVSQAIYDRLRKQPARRGSLETVNLALECTCIRRPQIEGNYESFCETYTNPDFWNRPDHSPKFPGTSETSSCSSAPDTTERLQGFITNDSIYDLRISTKQHTHLLTSGSRRCKEQLNNSEQSSTLENTSNKKVNTQIGLEEGLSSKNTPSDLLKQVIHKLEANVTGGLVTLKPTTTPKTVRFSYDKDTCSLSSGTIYASNSTDMTPSPFDFSENIKDEVYSSYESHGSIFPEFKVYKKIQR